MMQGYLPFIPVGRQAGKFSSMCARTKTVQPVFCYSGVTLHFPDLFFPQNYQDH